MTRTQEFEVSSFSSQLPPPEILSLSQEHYKLPHDVQELNVGNLLPKIKWPTGADSGPTAFGCSAQNVEPYDRGIVPD
jgi:hypothetical protein